METKPHPHNAPAGAQTTPAASAPNAGYQAGAVPAQQLGNPLDRFWNLYLVDTERVDKKLTDGWKGDTDGILIFTGLFSTTVASFIIAVSPSLSPNLEADTVALLKQIAQQQISGPSGSQSPIILPSDSFRAPPSVLRVNVLWMLSFFLSLFCALASTLVQQWTRQYLADSHPRGPLSERGPIHAYLRLGIERFRFSASVDFIVTLLHISVFLFVGGLLEFAFGLHLTVAYSLLGFTIAGAALYLILTALPVVYLDCPYKTPLTMVMRPLRIWYRSSCLYILEALIRTFDHSIPPSWPRWLASAKSRYGVWRKVLDLKNHVQEIRSRAQTLVDLPRLVTYQRPTHVLHQMVGCLDEDSERHQYLLALPSYFESLSKMRYPMTNFLEAGEWYDPLRQILASYTLRTTSESPTQAPQDLQPLEDLIIFESSLLATHRHLSRGNRLPLQDSSVVVSDWGSQIRDPLSSFLREFMTYNWPLYHSLLVHDNPAISLLAFCRMLSTDFIYPFESSILDYDLPLGHLQRFLPLGDRPTFIGRGDSLLLSFKNSPPKMANLYRLLYLTRTILHYGTARNELLETYEHIWVPILHDLSDQTFESELLLLPDETRLYVYKLISVVGRDDLLPYSDLGLPRNALRHDYSTVFVTYPVLGGCLRSIINAMGLPSDYLRIQLHHHTSASRLGSRQQVKEDVSHLDHGESRKMGRTE